MIFTTGISMIMTFFQRICRASLVVLIASALVLSGCDSMLDLDPKQSIGEDRALSTDANVKAALIGGYDALSDGDLYGGQLFMLPDLLGDDDDLNWTGTFEQPRQVWTKSIPTDNSFVEAQWNDAYETINVVNNVLSALDVVNEADRNRIEGEAKFIRGVLHFELVRLFGRAWTDGDPSGSPGVPIITEPTRGIDESANVSRNTVSEVYQQVISDLQDAENLLAEDNGVFADTYTASAMLSRVYMMQQDYDQAAAKASRVIESGKYALTSTFSGAFNNPEDPAEYIFSMQITSQDGANELNLFYGSTENTGRGDIDMTEAHLALYEDGDARRDFFYVDGDGFVRTGKWSNGINSNITDANLPIIRLAEMYLTRAEANFRAGTTVGAAPVDDINVIRERVNLDPLDSVTVEDIMRERELELAFEGHTLHDVKRLEGSVGSLSYDANNLVYPIPQREMDANENLTQNDGYGG